MLTSFRFCVNFNPRSLHGERLAAATGYIRQEDISIHAPCTGSDATSNHDDVEDEISIHAPCTGSDALAPTEMITQRGISIHAPCTGSDRVTLSALHLLLISIHAPYTGSDTFFGYPSGISKRFQSTLPARGATQQRCVKQSRKKFQSTLPARGATRPRQYPRACLRDFNPRSLHGERRTFSVVMFFPPNFNPRSLHGERHAPQSFSGADEKFQSTLPARGATRPAIIFGGGRKISIHAPCTGSDTFSA